MSRIHRLVKWSFLVVLCSVVLLSPLDGLSHVGSSDREGRHLESKDKVCRPSDDATLQILRSVFELHVTSNDDMFAKLFETGGGDPAMNGSKLILVLGEQDFVEGYEYLYDTGIDISQLESFEFRGNAIAIRVQEHIEKNNEIVTIRSEYLFQFRMNRDGHLEENLSLNHKILGRLKE